MGVDDRSTVGSLLAEVRARGGQVEVVRSAARRRSSSAGVRDGCVVIRIPAHLGARREAATIGQLLQRLHARATAAAPVTTLPPRVAARPTRGPRGDRGDRDLAARADRVATRWMPDHALRADRVTWSHRMTTRWASCTVPPGRIRVSHRLADAPDTVLDVLLLHELAHVVEPGHGPAFRRLADRHPDRPDVDAWLAGRTRRDLRVALGLG